MPSVPRVVTALTLIGLLLIGGALRFHGLDWDDGQHLHPDERFLAIVGDKIRFPSHPLDYFDTRKSPLNPYNQGFDGFAYGTAPLFITRGVAELLGMASYDRINLVGRGLSALVDVGTIGLTFVLGRLVYGRAVGLAAAALLSVTVLHLQLSHFFAVDTFLAFATTLALCAAYLAWLGGTFRGFALLGFALGLAAATKLSAALLLPIAALTVLVPPPNGRSLGSILERAARLATCGLVAVLVYRVGDPYSFAGPGFFDLRPNVQRFADLDRWVKISSGEVDVPFMIQWAGTPSPSFALRGIAEWGFGPPAALAAFAGLALAAWQLRHWSRHGAAVLLVAWTALNLVYFGFQFAKFLRYLLPAYPSLAVLGAYMLLRLARQPATSSPLLGRLGKLVLPAVLGATALYAAMFSSIYARPNTRVTASEWLYAQVAPGATLAVEHWDDALPLRLPGRERDFREVTLELYADESPEKARKLADNLRRADYVILSSERLLGSIPRLPTRFPIAVEYYRLLFGGDLGFDLVAQFDSRPRLLWMSLDDRQAQEDFTVYDHPTVRIFKKAERFSAESVAAQLAAVPLDGVERIKAVEAGSRGGLTLAPDEWSAVRAAGTWSTSFALDGWAARLPILAWLLVVEGLSLAALPVCWWLFPHLPDRGLAASKVVGLLIVSYLAWLGASLHLVPFGRGSSAIALVLLALGSVLLSLRHRRELVGDLRARRRSLLLTEVVFLVSFGFMLAVRAANPDLWHPHFGGEKPMDFAYLNAVIKSASFPPYDPWFAGGYINYYYFGFVLVAVLTHLAAVPPAQAYNLGVATIFATTATAAFAVGATIAAGRYARPGRLLGGVVTAGAISVLCLGVLGNLDGVLQLREGLWKLGGEGVPSILPLITGLTRTVSGLVAVVRGAALPPFDFWRSTRFIGPEHPGPIHEFPFFTFLYGDLHAHMISMPLQVSAVLVGLQIVRTGWRSSAAPRMLALLALAALLVGSLRATNTWDFPTYLGITTAAAVLAARPARSVSWLVAGGMAAGVAAAVYAASSLLFLPFLHKYELFYSGFTRVEAVTDVAQFLIIHGLLLFVTGSWLIREALRLRPALARGPGAPAWPGGSFYGVAAPPIELAMDGRAVALGTLAIGLLGVLVSAGRGVIAIVIAVGLAAWVIGRARRRSPERWFLLALGGAASATLVLPELVAVRGDVGRMNTVFKFYLQGWLLLSLLAGPAVVALLRRHRSASRAPAPWLRAWAMALGLLMLGALVYPVLATPARSSLRFAQLPPTLDGMAFMARARHTENRADLALPDDYRAIRWMLENVEGTPVILEGQAPLYRWGSRFSVYTGLPTVVGWDWHQKQQRWAYQERVDQRGRDVAAAYESSNGAVAWHVLRKYRVEYVVVGGLERAYYPPAGLEKFEHMVGEGLQVAYRDGAVTIYRVAGA